MICKVQHKCGSEAKLTHINENYISHGMCGKCGGARHQRLKIDLIFDNLIVGHTEETVSTFA